MVVREREKVRETLFCKRQTRSSFLLVSLDFFVCFFLYSVKFKFMYVIGTEIHFFLLQKLPFTDFLNERLRMKCRLQIGVNKDIKLQIVPLYTLCKEYTTYTYEKKYQL